MCWCEVGIVVCRTDVCLNGGWAVVREVLERIVVVGVVCRGGGCSCGCSCCC